MDSATTCPNRIAKPQQSLPEAWLQTPSSLGGGSRCCSTSATENITDSKMEVL